MPSQAKLIKNGIKYTDKLFQEIIRRLEQGVLTSDTLEEFLANTSEYTSANPLVSTGYDAKMLSIILQETNNHKFSRPAQKQLTRITIEEKVGELIQNVGEDIKGSVRDIVMEEYNQGSNPDKMAKRIRDEVTVIKNKRAKTIARTEVARTATVSEYIISKEEGATHFVVDCRSTRCPKCQEAYCKNSATGGDVEYSMEDTSMLPPYHPNCRCVAVFYKDSDPDKYKGKVSLKPFENKTNSKSTTTNEVLPTKTVKPHFDKFADETALDRSEHMLYVSSNGDVSPIAHGGNKSVKASEAQKKWIKEQLEQGNEVYGTHNHSYTIDPEHNTANSYTIFSLSDLQSFSDNLKVQKSFSAEGPRNRITITRVKDYYKGQDMAIDFMMQLHSDFIRDVIDAPTPKLLYLREVRNALTEQGLEGVDLRNAMKPYEEKAEAFNTEDYFNQKKLELIRDMDKAGKEYGVRVTYDLRDLDSLNSEYRVLKDPIKLEVPKSMTKTKSEPTSEPEPKGLDLTPKQQKEHDKLTKKLDSANKAFSKATTISAMKKAKVRVEKAQKALEEFMESIEA